MGNTRTLYQYISDHNDISEQTIVVTSTQDKAEIYRKEIPPTIPVTTFDLLAYALLSQNNKFVSLITPEDRMNIIKPLAEKYKQELSIADNSIKAYKGSLASSKNDLVKEYNSVVSSRGLMDFEDMAAYLFEVAQKDSVIRERIQLQFKSVYIDGLEDLTLVQYRILKVIAAPENNMYAVEPERTSESLPWKYFQKEFPDNILKVQRKKALVKDPKSQMSLF